MELIGGRFGLSCNDQGHGEGHFDLLTLMIAQPRVIKGAPRNNDGNERCERASFRSASLDTKILK